MDLNFTVSGHVQILLSYELNLTYTSFLELGYLVSAALNLMMKQCFYVTRYVVHLQDALLLLNFFTMI